MTTNPILFVKQAQFEFITSAWQDEARLFAKIEREATDEEKNEMFARLFHVYTKVLGDPGVLDIIAQHPGLKIQIGESTRLENELGVQVWPALSA